ncbi:MAG: hypothetical protein E1N59_522 [Puniceicoccaceae bacterium 5H]|nr:MAG: hypothetical protein E1N59_522 [Puniceicoccaceae bacterium 5H]
MDKTQKFRVAAITLLVLGVAMLIGGIAGGLVPPALTGIGFLVLGWALW